MATRRRSTGSAGAPSRSSSKTAGKRPGRDGKTTVPCPACGSEYRVPVEMLDDQIQCKSCNRVFVPSASSNRRNSRQNPATPFIVGGAILVIAIAFGVIISSSGGKQDEPAPKPKAVAAETGLSNPRVRDVQEWVEALQTGNEFKLQQLSDWPALAKFLGVGADALPSDLAAAVMKELREGPRAAFLRITEVTGAAIPAANANDPEGFVDVNVVLRGADEKKKWSRETGEYRVQFRTEGGRHAIIGWDATFEPKQRVVDPNRERAVKHEILGTAQDVERTVNGAKFTAREAELMPLPHLDGTTPEQQTAVDTAVEQLLDLEDPRISNRAAIKLKQLGKPSVPRLLSKMHEIVTATKMETHESKLMLKRIEGALEGLTGQRFGFDPSAAIAGNTAKEEYRLSALKQWYGWWADNHWRKDFDYAIEKEESLERTPPKTDGDAQSGEPKKTGEPKKN